MAKAVKQPASSPEKIVLSIDIGGSHVKILSSAGGGERRADSGPGLTPQQMIDAVKKLAEGLSYDVVSMGYPGPVNHNRPLIDPANLGKGWAGYDFAAQFGKPVKVVNDALMLAMGAPWLNTKMVVAISPDTDIDDARDIYLAMATRVDPARDIVVVPNTRGSLFDPSGSPIEGQEPHRLVGKIGIAATAKARHNIKDFERAWPVNWGKVRLEDYL